MLCGREHLLLWCAAMRANITLAALPGTALPLAWSCMLPPSPKSSPVSPWMAGHTCGGRMRGAARPGTTSAQRVQRMLRSAAKGTSHCLGHFGQRGRRICSTYAREACRR